MNLDGILGILAVIFFVVLPIFSSIAEARKKNEQAGKPQDPAGGPAPARPPAESRDPGFDLDEAMAEARRRIQAQTQAERGTPVRPVAQTPAAPRGATVMTTTISGQRIPGGQPQQSIDWQASPAPPRPAPPRQRTRAAPREQRQSARTGAAEIAADLQVTRLPARKPYTERAQKVAGPGLTGRAAVLNGLIWHQVLSERPMARRYRRRASRLP